MHVHNFWAKFDFFVRELARHVENWLEKGVGNTMAVRLISLSGALNSRGRC